MTDLPTAQEYAENHKKAFRIAFNFLNLHFPPEHSEAWWNGVCRDVSDAARANNNDYLTMELLAGVLDYLNEETGKRRPKEEEKDAAEN